LIKRSRRQSPDHSVPSTKAIYINMEKFMNRENSLGGVEMGVFSIGLYKL